MTDAYIIIEHADDALDRGEITLGEYEKIIKPWREAEPVRHGRWIWLGGSLYECSECGAWVVAQDRIPIELYKFCRGCGAKMDEVEE